MIAEDLVLVALFNIALLGSLFLERGSAFFCLRIAQGEPVGKLHGLGRAEFCFQAAKYRQVDRAVLRLRALGLDEVDGGIADKVGHKEVRRVMVDLQRRLILLENAVIDEADLRGEGHGLHLVVRNVDEGGAGLNVQALEFVAHFKAELRVQVRERLVHEQNRGLRGESPCDGNTLLLAAGELGGVALHEHTDFDDAADAADGEVDFLLRELSHLRDDFTALYIAEFIVQCAACVLRGLFRGFDLGGQGGNLRSAVGVAFQMIVKQALGRVLREGKRVDQL